MPKNILFYTSFNSRSRDTESVMEHFVSEGHKVFLLTQGEEGEYHEACKKIGVECQYYPLKKKNFFQYFFLHALYLYKFILSNKIEIVFSHLENASLPAVLIQSFVRSKIIVCRHIIDEAYLLKSKKFILQNKIVYKLAKHVIVVSNRAKHFMVNHEGISSKKITVIPLLYNFNLYETPNENNIQKIRNEYHSDLLLITACRLVKPKRPQLSIEIAETLIKQGKNIKLLILGTGPESENLKKIVTEKKLNTNIYILGFKPNIIDYLSAADLLLHPSLLDSSSVIIKEAGLVKKPIIACNEVGDLDEYIINYNSGLLVDKNFFFVEATRALENILFDKFSIKNWGINLNKIIMNKFNIKYNSHLYKRFL